MRKELLVTAAIAALITLAGCSSPSGAEITPIEFPDPAVSGVIEPGAVLSAGEAAWVPYEKSGGEVAGIALIDVMAGEASFWNEFGNGDEFAHLTPYFIVYQVQAAEGGQADFGPEAVPLLADGTDGAIIELDLSLSPATKCPIEIPVLDNEEIEIRCVVGVDPDDANAVVGIAWHNVTTGIGLNFGNDPATNPWLENPATWKVKG